MSSIADKAEELQEEGVKIVNNLTPMQAINILNLLGEFVDFFIGHVTRNDQHRHMEDIQ